MDIDKILKELDTISGSRKRNTEWIKEKLKQAKTLAENDNYSAATMIKRLVSAYSLFLIEEKLEALNKTILYISKKDG
jgi:hypothetical protein